MVDQSWDAYTEKSSSRGFPGWLKWIMGIGVGFVLLIALFVGSWAAADNRVWPSIRHLGRTLQTDEGAKAVYAANPLLKDVYPDAQAFLEAVAPHRVALATLPERIPNAEAVELFTEPKGFFCRVRLTPVCWMQIRVQERSLFGQGSSPDSGIDTLLFAENIPALRKAMLQLKQNRMEVEWKAFLDIARSLETEEGTRSLYFQTPALGDHFPNAEAFLSQTRRWRALKPILPARLSDAQTPIKSRGGKTPFINSSTLAFRLPEGQTLEMTWTNQKLTRVRFIFENSAPRR